MRSLLLVVIFALFAAGAIGETTLLHQISLDGENEEDAQVGSNLSSPLAVSPDGRAAMVFYDEDNGERLMFALVDASGETTLEEIPYEYNLRPDYERSVLFDHLGRPNVFVLPTNKVYRRYIRENDGWDIQEIPVDPVNLYGDGTARLGQHQSAVKDYWGQIHLYCFVYANAKVQVGILHCIYNEETGWRFEKMPMIDGGAWEYFQFQCDRWGRTHLVTKFADDDGYRQLHYYYYEGGVWHMERVKGSDNFDTEPSYAATLALDNNDTPYIASFYLQRANTGSFQLGKLKYNVRKGDNDWDDETIVSRSDGYRGSDGDDYTGQYPTMIFDANNIPHIIFCDMASWHEVINPDYGSWNLYCWGQVRHAWKTGGDWHDEVLYSQPSPMDQMDPLVDFVMPAFGMSPNGGVLHVFGSEHITIGGSPMYFPDRPQTNEALYFRFKTDFSPGENNFQRIMSNLLGYTQDTSGLDQDTNGLLGASDLRKAQEAM